MAAEKLTDFHLPVDMGEFNIHSPEVMYYLYLPIKTPGSGLRPSLPDARLHFLDPLIGAVQADEWERYSKEYLYLTVKKMFVGGGVTANRPGWHCDGFLSDDLNYVWYDSVPTVFVESELFEITPDHNESLKEFELQCGINPWWVAPGQNGSRRRSRPPKEVFYPNKHLLKLDDRVIHRVNVDVPEQVMRTFVKLTLSKNRFNLKDNSINPLLPLEGPLYERAMVRNDPHQAQRDYYKPEPIDDHMGR